MSALFRRVIAFPLLFLSVASVQAQNNGNNNDNTFSGITIDADGVLKTRAPKPFNVAAQKKLQQKFVSEQLSPEMIRAAAQRVISLKALEQAVLTGLEAEPFPLAVRYLCGLQRIDAVVFDPEGRDVLLVGPAEGFAPDAQGRMLGLTSGRPPMQLDDLVVALRAASTGVRTVGCSIDPTQENMARLQQFLRSNSTPSGTGTIQRRFRTMANLLGQQQITLWGVPEDSHFALALVDADYRMKRISLGLDPSGVPGITSQLSLRRPHGNSLQRWWFVPMYEPIEVNSQQSVYRLKGPRARLLAQEELTDSSGRRVDASTTRESTQEFARRFSEHLPELAAKSPPFAELQNLYDLFMAAAIIRKDPGEHLRGWEMATLLSDSRLPLEHYPVPKRIGSESTYRMAHDGLIIGLVGGVTMDSAPVLKETTVVPQLPGERFRESLPAQSWWGDAGL
ncbi:DUF1598 domain-containing protein [Planctomicrobium sp. SH664]|uniref:DUF1598 domain-containing protein n=1 Tax=Planctomicrobium sp. SH664 TaxID=3448125 RepID=UPI003F5CA2BE